MWCAPVPCLYLWLLAALAPTCLSYIREPRSRFIIQTWQRAKITTFNLLVMLFQCSPGWLWPSLLLAHVQLGVDQEFSVASLQSFFPAGWPPGIILLVQDLACPYAECFQAYKRDQYLNMFSNHSGKGLLWLLLLTPFSLLPKAFAQRGRERIEQCKNCCGLLANGSIRKNLTTFEASSFHQSERAGLVYLWQVWP